VYVLDRATGKPIAAHPFTAQNWAKYIDLKTGKPVLTDLLDRAIKGETIDLNPRLGTNSTLSAFNQRTGMLYLNSWEILRVMKFVDEKLIIGAGYTGIETSSKIPEITGYHVAMNPLTGKTAWKIPLRDFAVSAGTLGTDGGLLFTGKLTGEVIALDQDSGKQLWQFKTGSSVNAPPVTYTYKGVQYVSVLSGRGGSNPSRSAGAVVPTGGSVWTFALMRD
jgi:alcohol dehydrogenase (cytochrome c)